MKTDARPPLIMQLATSWPGRRVKHYRELALALCGKSRKIGLSNFKIDDLNMAGRQ
jgi:diketogulonate reductase-like aldo/keto reductase